MNRDYISNRARTPFRLRVIALALALFGATAQTVSATEIPAMTPERLLGEYRLLVACNAPELPSPLDWKSFHERDLMLLESVQGVVYILNRDKKGNAMRGGFDQSERLQKIVKCSDKAEFVLIGKDGGVKRRWQNAILVDDLFQTIDAMPMRQFEMKTRDAK